MIKAIANEITFLLIFPSFCRMKLQLVACLLNAITPFYLLLLIITKA